ncbi:RER2 [Candida oxycetoniae]|uniref:Alkyl transferase n=1 Tax=Candida oxycetoniae TaxID=497107 RepID=A0AAI9WWT8_9ASCO|nr:RER2 [Candida oxycetoniae]KAI3403596.2 RER2 [Candida oxycetoniae]
MSDWISTFPGYRQLFATGKKMFGRILSTGPVPQHVGIIMDGNRRYAKSHKLEIKEGHSLGFDTMANILELLYESGVKATTVYAFSIENFNRSSYEVKWLMDLAKAKFTQINQNGLLCRDYGVRIKILGNLSLLPPDVLKILHETEEITKHNTRAVLNVCFPYTSRDEMTYAIKNIVDNATRSSSSSVIDESTIDKYLYTGDVQPLDLLVRTSGTFRLSDFLLWQSVSPDCAVVFVDKLWPEFSPWDMLKILINWSFNKYWYGNACGNGVNSKVLVEKESKMVEEAEPLISGSKYNSGFKRIRSEDDEDDENSDISSSKDVDTGEDTVTSEDEGGALLKK